MIHREPLNEVNTVNDGYQDLVPQEALSEAVSVALNTAGVAVIVSGEAGSNVPSSLPIPGA
jgi:hypothetical protein